MQLTSDLLSCAGGGVEGLMAWVGDNKRSMVEMAQVMETNIRFGLLERSSCNYLKTLLCIASYLAFIDQSGSDNFSSVQENKFCAQV